jgi:hypothetical protein
MASTTTTLCLDIVYERIPSVHPFRRSRPMPVRLGDRRYATSSTTRDGSKSALHVWIASQWDGSAPFDFSWTLNNFMALQAPGTRLDGNDLAASPVSLKSHTRQAQLGYDPLFSHAEVPSMYSPTLQLTPIGRACCAHDCLHDSGLCSGVRAEGRSQSSLSTQPEPVWAPINLHDLVHASRSLQFEACTKIKPKFGSRSCRRVENLCQRHPDQRKRRG